MRLGTITINQCSWWQLVNSQAIPRTHLWALSHGLSSLMPTLTVKDAIGTVSCSFFNWPGAGARGLEDGRVIKTDAMMNHYRLVISGPVVSVRAQITGGMPQGNPQVGTHWSRLKGLPNFKSKIVFSDCNTYRPHWIAYREDNFLVLKTTEKP